MDNIASTAIENKEIFRNIIERRAGNLLSSTDGIITSLFNGNPAITKIAQNFVNAKKQEYLPKIQDYCDLLVETSFLDPNTTLEQAIANAEVTLNEFINNLISEKTDIDAGLVQISLQTLLGNQIFKL